MTDAQTFQVHLGNLITLLSRNLYSGNHVFVREMLQNANDAITARRQIDPNAPAEIRVITDNESVYFVDTGIGITREQASELLATIGATSKLDELGLHRSDFLGQFGIGLLSGFLVASTITVYSRSLKTPEQTIKWVGREDGTWTIEFVQEPEVPAYMPPIGSCVVLQARETEPLFNYQNLHSLITTYAQYLPVEIYLERSGTMDSQLLSCNMPPWQMSKPDLSQWCSENLGFFPFAVIPLNFEPAGLQGCAFINGAPTHPGRSSKHLVYLQNMLLDQKASDLLPDWGYFATVVANTNFLQPTASREELFQDDLFLETQNYIGATLHKWLHELAKKSAPDFQHFVSLHGESLKLLAISDQPTRALVWSLVKYETTLGRFTLEEIANTYGAIRYVCDLDDYRQMQALAQVNEICILNGAYAFVEELLNQLHLDFPQLKMIKVEPQELLDCLQRASLSSEATLLPLLTATQNALESQNLEVSLRAFSPATLPALYFPPAFPHPSIDEIEQSDEVSLTLSEMLSTLEKQDPRDNLQHTKAQFVLNVDCPLNYQLANFATEILKQDINSGRENPATKSAFDAAIRGLYVQSLLAGQHVLDPESRAWASSVFTTLVKAAFPPKDDKNVADAPVELPNYQSPTGSLLPQPRYSDINDQLDASSADLPEDNS